MKRNNNNNKITTEKKITNEKKITKIITFFIKFIAKNK